MQLAVLLSSDSGVSPVVTIACDPWCAKSGVASWHIKCTWGLCRGCSDCPTKLLPPTAAAAGSPSEPKQSAANRIESAAGLADFLILTYPRSGSTWLMEQLGLNACVATTQAEPLTEFIRKDRTHHAWALNSLSGAAGTTSRTNELLEQSADYNAQVQTDLKAAYEQLAGRAHGAQRVCSRAARGFKVMLKLLPGGSKGSNHGVDAALAVARARNASVVHFMRKSAVRQKLSLLKMGATGIVHKTGKPGEAAHDQPFSYQITPEQLARSVLHELNLEAIHVTAIRRRLPAAQVMTIFYEDLLRQAEGSTWADLLRHLNADERRKAKDGQVLLRSSSTLHTCSELYPQYPATEAILLSAYDRLPEEQQRVLSFAIQDCNHGMQADKVAPAEVAEAGSSSKGAGLLANLTNSHTSSKPDVPVAPVAARVAARAAARAVARAAARLGAGHGTVAAPPDKVSSKMGLSRSSSALAAAGARSGPQLAAVVTVFAHNAARQLPGGFICSALGALATGCDALLQGGAASCTRLVITNNLSAASTRALSSCGASVRDMACTDEPLHLRWGALDLDYSGLDATKLKFAVLGLREFDGVLLLDWDMFLLGAQSWQPRKQPWLFQHNSKSNTASPVNAGLFGVQPSLQRELRVLALLQQTFSEVDGWGGPYSNQLLDVLRGFRRPSMGGLDCLPRHGSPARIQSIIAKRQARHPSWSPAQNASEAAAFCFISAEVDQGLLVHMLAAEEAFDGAFLTHTHPGTHFYVPRVHFSGLGRAPKPMAATSPAAWAKLSVEYKKNKRYAAIVDKFWTIWRDKVDPLLELDGPACHGMCQKEMGWANEQWRVLQQEYGMQASVGSA
jgi:LPS sulfotransferase NodH